MADSIELGAVSGSDMTGKSDTRQTEETAYGDLIGRLLSNPEVVSNLSGVLSSLNLNSKPSAEPREMKNATQPAISPEMISALPNIMNLLKGFSSGSSGANALNAGGASNEKQKEQSASSVRGASGQAAADSADGSPLSDDLNSVAAFAKRLFGGKESENRNALLCALKPYLSNSRRETVENLIKFGQLGDILKKFN